MMLYQDDIPGWYINGKSPSSVKDEIFCLWMIKMIKDWPWADRLLATHTLFPPGDLTDIASGSQNSHMQLVPSVKSLGSRACNVVPRFTIAKLVNITPITMLYATSMTIVFMGFINQQDWGWHGEFSISDCMRDPLIRTCLCKLQPKPWLRDFLVEGLLGWGIFVDLSSGSWT